MKLLTINVTAWQPGTHSHILHVLKGKHPGKKIKILHRMGGEVDYLTE